MYSHIHHLLIKCTPLPMLTFVSPTAYQLRTCQPPPPVANATVLTDDDEFEIGLSYFISLVYGPDTMCDNLNLHQTKGNLDRKSVV